MPKLKDYFESDLDTFINDDEFSTIHTINGVEMQIIMDSDKLKTKQAKDGVYEGDVLFHVKKSVFGEAPAIGNLIELDGGTYRVTDFQEDEGLYSITLAGNMS